MSRHQTDQVNQLSQQVTSTRCFFKLRQRILAQQTTCHQIVFHQIIRKQILREETIPTNYANKFRAQNRPNVF